MSEEHKNDDDGDFLWGLGAGWLLWGGDRKEQTSTSSKDISDDPLFPYLFFGGLFIVFFPYSLILLILLICIAVPIFCVVVVVKIIADLFTLLLGLFTLLLGKIRMIRENHQRKQLR